MPCATEHSMPWRLWEWIKSGKSSCAKASEDKLKSGKLESGKRESLKRKAESRKIKVESRKSAYAPAFVKTSAGKKSSGG